MTDDNRLISIYESYDSKILEGFKKERKYAKSEMMRQDFYRYLKSKYPDFDKKEFTEAKTKEEAEKVANKYRKDFATFVNKQPKRIIPLAIHLGILLADFTGFIPKEVSNKLYNILLIDDLIYYGKEYKYYKSNKK
jgi:hypothetical protein